MSGINELLPDDLLTEIRNRARGYDERNEFCIDDLLALKATGYLKAGVPAERGGGGLSLSELSLAQRRLAGASPAAALAVNMHLLWGAVAKFMSDRGDTRLDWVFDDMVAGEIFAFGISEAGNDSVLLDSSSTATPDGDDYLVNGMKIFTTLSPVWTRLGMHARTEGEDARIVVGFMRREALEGGQPRSQDNGGEGIEYPHAWNTLGMRATQSWNTKLTNARLLGGDVVTSYEPYDMQDLIISAVSLTFGILTTSVYAGIGDRALEIAREAVNEPMGDGIKLDDPQVAQMVSEAVLEHRASVDMLELIASDIDAEAPRDDWSLAIAAVKNRVTDEARDAVEAAIRTLGARAFNADHELARMYRDVVAGIFHPRSARSLAAAVRTSLIS
ncbi:acyl-CoA/acyl-ACP dehydrogenase [Leucobacter sp. UCMA 4100]|uniref:acyl-CoA dehydrogenase family protein n=1 Tax=Leucobacter sp. UCMA 4100 TaxID=2810534 RepID=UPI0022EA7533|nr:acyl-CoA dehydrogenase family protein [Leucobacter sp. UCMA 4100]MDA3147695.1 acyl-CoA/acyl-ACP dehydrogenase [Leucobacter sp. UCMA 4100]